MTHRARAKLAPVQGVLQTPQLHFRFIDRNTLLRGLCQNINELLDLRYRLNVRMGLRPDLFQALEDVL